MRKRTWAALSVLMLLAGFGVVATSGQEDDPGFPAAHQALLGGSSYRAYFGLDPAAPGPDASLLAPGLGSRKGPPPNVSPNTVVNAPQFPFPNGLLGRSETTVAADTSNRNLVVGWNDADGFCGPPFNVPCVPAIPTGPGLSGFGWSTNGGATWTDGGAPFVVVTPGGSKVTRGDPVLDSGGPGKNTFYYANLAVDITTSSPGLGGMTVHTGQFSQGSFSFNNGVFIASPNAPNDFLDKEWLCAGKTSLFKDEVAVTVTNFIEVAGIPFFGFGQIEAYLSSDRAGSFTAVPTIVQPDETISVPLNQGIINQGSNCAYGPNGELYVTWERGWLAPFFGQGAAGVWPHIAFAASFDGGLTFGPRQLVSDISSASLFPPAGYNRGNYNDFPRICAATKDDDPFRGRVYVTYQDSRVGNGGTQAMTGGFGHPDADVYVRSSDDGGVTWTAPTLVAGGPNRQFWPAVECNQSDGDVDVVWYEQTAGPPPLVDVFYARSTDGGASFTAPLRVTTVSTNWGATATNIRPNFGDYIDLISNSNRVHVTWADGRNGVPDTFYSSIKTN